MARARRLASFARLCVPMNLRELASNRAEVLRVVNSGSVDFATARLMLWAMDLTAAALPAERIPVHAAPITPMCSITYP
jgi:hypothetical protein